MAGDVRCAGAAEGIPRPCVQLRSSSSIPRLRTVRTLRHAAPRVPESVRRLKELFVRIVIPGGSGQVGTVLARAFHGDGHDVVVLSRGPQARPWRVVAWDGVTPGAWR